jgi:hypothetical protein
MKKLLTTAIICSIFITVHAQRSDLKFGVGFDLGIPAHNLSGTSIGLGLDLMALYRLSKEAAATGDIGYTALLGKNGAGTSNLIPLRVGLRYYASPDIFIGAKIGVGFLSNNRPNTSSLTTTAYSFGVGYAGDPHFEVGASYDGYSKNGTVGLVNIRLGYFFNNK